MTTQIDQLNETDKTLHSLAQLIALTSMQWLPPRPDDSQTNILWNADRQRLEGQPFGHNGQLVQLVIDTEPFALHFVDDRGLVIASFWSDHHTPDEAMAWWTGLMQTWGLTSVRPLNYQLDTEPVARQRVYEQPAGLSAWARWRTVANVALQNLNDWSGQSSDVRIWPHHFDTGVYYSLPDASGHERAAIWAGYAIADALCPEPYFYLSGYEGGQTLPFADAPALPAGDWRNTPDWKGALLPISEAVDPERIDSFFRESYTWLYTIVNGGRSD